MARKKKLDDDAQVDLPAPTEDYIAAVAAAAWDGGRAFRVRSGGFDKDRQDMQPWEFAARADREKHMAMIRLAAAGKPIPGDEPEEVIARALFRHYD